MLDLRNIFPNTWTSPNRIQCWAQTHQMTAESYKKKTTKTFIMWSRQPKKAWRSRSSRLWFIIDDVNAVWQFDWFNCKTNIEFGSVAYSRFSNVSVCSVGFLCGCGISRIQRCKNKKLPKVQVGILYFGDFTRYFCSGCVKVIYLSLSCNQ